MNLKTRITTLYRGFNTAERLIFINVVIFAVMAIFNAVYHSFTKDSISFFMRYFALPNDLGALLWKPWTVITYAFIHADFSHLLFNCLVLYFSGKIFKVFFTEKQFLTVYFFGILAGGIAFLLSFNLLPAFKDEVAVLMGASGAVLAIVLTAATYAPNFVVRLFGIFSVKYWIIAALAVIAYISYIPSSNAGGHFAHIGGAAIGFLYARQFAKGKNIGSGFEKFMDQLKTYFSPKKKQPFKTVYKNTSAKKSSSYQTKTAQNATENQRKIDHILDKISKSGYESLTKKEKDFLFKAGKDH